MFSRNPFSIIKVSLRIELSQAEEEVFIGAYVKVSL